MAFLPGRKSEQRVPILNPKPGTKPVRISATRYYDLKGAMLCKLGASAQGIAFADLADACSDSISSPLWEGSSLGWYVTSVKLDLEARGLIHRTSRKGRQLVHLGPGAG
ncbi:MAG: hypothetical protein OXP37_03880 [Chloroflexota bacterium]|nr:hypothetical protein [Chloroflexota bacterium]